MQIKVNGKIKQYPENTTVLEILKEFEIDEKTEGVAVAVDEELVLKVQWKTFVLSDGQSIEIVWARQGG